MILNILKEHSRLGEIKSLCKIISEKTRDIYLFGRNQYSLEIIKLLDIKGVIDEYAVEDNFYDIPIIKNLDFIQKDISIVISCIIGKPWTAKHKLDLKNIMNIDYFSFWKYSGFKLLDERNWLEFNKNFDFESYQKLCDLLVDLESKRTLENIVNFRLTQDLQFMKFYTDRQYYQYFESFLGLTDERFVDVGGFDGFTSELFISLNPGCRGVEFIEPDINNFNLALNRLKNSLKINYYHIGLGDKRETLKLFNNGSKSVITNEGNLEVKIDTLDDLSLNFSDLDKLYIKFDIEGWEMSALIGAQNLIRKHKPKLAVCVYHKPNDLIELSSFILQLNPSYFVFLRHYTEGVDETVMYFIPR
jgi:FkbM family methyltransferase